MKDGLVVSPQGVKYASTGRTNEMGNLVFERVAGSGGSSGNFAVFTGGNKIDIGKSVVTTNPNSYWIRDGLTDPMTYVYGSAILDIVNDIINPSLPASTKTGQVYTIFNGIVDYLSKTGNNTTVSPQNDKQNR